MPDVMPPHPPVQKKKKTRSSRACTQCRRRKVRCFTPPGHKSCNRCRAYRLPCSENGWLDEEMPKQGCLVRHGPRNGTQGPFRTAEEGHTEGNNSVQVNTLGGLYQELSSILTTFLDDPQQIDEVVYTTPAEHHSHNDISSPSVASIEVPATLHATDSNAEIAEDPMHLLSMFRLAPGEMEFLSGLAVPSGEDKGPRVVSPAVVDNPLTLADWPGYFGMSHL